MDGSSPKNYLGNAASDDYRGTIRGVGESLIPLVDSDRIPTAGTFNSSDSVSCNVMPLVYETVKQYATGPSSTILVLTRGSSRKQVKQVIANIQSPLHGYHHRETIDIKYASEFQNLLIVLYPHDEAKRNSCRLWRDWSPVSFCEHLNLVFPMSKMQLTRVLFSAFRVWNLLTISTM